MSNSMGLVLRELNGQGPVEVLTRVKDFNIQTVNNGDREAVVPADTLVAFRAGSFRELEVDDGPSDLWEFRTSQPLEGGAVTQHKVYLRGEDIFMVRVPSQLAL